MSATKVIEATVLIAPGVPTEQEVLDYVAAEIDARGLHVEGPIERAETVPDGDMERWNFRILVSSK